jgi:hypothetical protein
MSARGFVMPLMVLLVLVVGLSLSVYLTRQSQHSLTVRRQVDQYEAHHVGRGLSEIIDAWIRDSLRGRRAIKDILGENGHAFDITIPEGLSGRGRSETVRIRLKDGQGTVLSDLSGLAGQPLSDAKDLLSALREVAGDRAKASHRRYGPVQISIQSASREVLVAAATAAGAGANADSFLGSIERSLGDRTTLSADSIRVAATDAGFQPDVAAKLQRLLSADTSFWQIIAEVRVSNGLGGDTMVDRYVGYAQISSSGGRRERSSSGWSRHGTILVFDREFPPPAE